MNPIVKYNSELCDKLVAKVRLSSRYPKVSDQLPTIPIEPGRLVRFGYNPSIIVDQELLTMAYRFHDGDTLATRLAIARLSLDGKVLSNRALTGNGMSTEDPRLFRYDGHVYMCWVESDFPKMPPHAIVKYGKLEEGQIADEWQPALPGNDFSTIQKNYVMFEYHESPSAEAARKLWCLYRCSPVQQIFELDVERPVALHESPGLSWPWGEPRGGTVPLPYGGHLLRFFHSGLDNEFGPYRRRYYMGAMLHEITPPFRQVAISQHPILYGSEVDDLKPSEWQKCKHRKPQVVFPCGAISTPEGWLVSVGVNDYQCALVKVTEKDLHI